MLASLYDSLKNQLLTIDGMTSQPYQTKTGNGPAGGIEQFMLNGRPFVGLRLTDTFLMLYAGPVLGAADQQFRERLKPIQSGKGCLKITRPEKADMAVLSALFTEAAAVFLSTSDTTSGIVPA